MPAFPLPDQCQFIDRPSPTTAAEVMHDMDGRVDMVIDGGPCHIGVESTIVECSGDDKVTILRPGGVTIEMLKEIVPVVEMDTTLVTGKGVPKAPGMKYRHYAPSAPMTVVVGTEDKVTAKLQSLYEGLRQKGRPSASWSVKKWAAISRTRTCMSGAITTIKKPWPTSSIRDSFPLTATSSTSS